MNAPTHALRKILFLFITLLCAALPACKNCNCGVTLFDPFDQTDCDTYCDQIACNRNPFCPQNPTFQTTAQGFINAANSVIAALHDVDAKMTQICGPNEFDPTRAIPNRAAADLEKARDASQNEEYIQGLRREIESGTKDLNDSRKKVEDCAARNHLPPPTWPAVAPLPPFHFPETLINQLKKAIEQTQILCGNNSPNIPPAQDAINSLQAASDAERRAANALNNAPPADQPDGRAAHDRTVDNLNNAMDHADAVLISTRAAAEACARSSNQPPPSWVHPAPANRPQQSQSPHFPGRPNTSQTHWPISSP